MHVLVLPSWYPAHKNDLSGSFFREQALALQEAGCKVGVLSIENSSMRSLAGRTLGSFGIRDEIDDGMYTMRYFGINFFPRLYFLQKIYMEYLGVKLFEEYIEKNGKPDLIHVQSIFNAGYAATAIKKKYGIPYVITEHSSSYVRNIVTPGQITLSASCVHSASKLFAVSTSICNLLDKKYDCCTWEVMPNIVSNVFFNHPESKKNHNFTFLTACVLNSNKNVNVLIDSFFQSFGSTSDSELWIVGEGDCKEELIQQVIALNLNDRVKFLGSLSRERMAEVMARSHVFVLASQYETFGLVVAESHAVGTPVIATLSGGPEDIVNDVNGILVAPNSVPDLSQALYDVRKRYDVYDANEIRKQSYREYSDSNITKKLLNDFKIIIENRLNAN